MGGGKGIFLLPSVGVACLAEAGLLGVTTLGVVLPEDPVCLDSNDAIDTDRARSDRIEPLGRN